MLESIGSFGFGLLIFIILLPPLMFIHELGHFIAAKKAGIRVEEFGMGFPPRAITLFKRGETAYTLNWLPIGAFVRMTGEELPDDPRSFAAQPKRWRLITLFGGPLMNFIGAFFILVFAYSFLAMVPTEYRYRIASVTEGAPGATIGMQPGDIVISANGIDLLQRVQNTENVNQSLNTNALRQQAQASIGKTMTLVVSRLDPANPTASRKEVTLSGAIPANANPDAPLGISIGSNVLKSERLVLNPIQAVSLATDDMMSTLVGMVRAPIEMARQKVPLEQARPVGPLGITKIGVDLVSERAEQGWFPFVRFAGFLSLALGFTNLLPIPALDGGRILFIFIEWIRGRRVDPRREQWVHAVGMVMLLGLSVIIVVLDIVKPISIR